MPPQSDMERLKEIKNLIADAGMVSQANAGSICAMREKLTGDAGETAGSVEDANAAIAELEEMVRDRDAENATPAPDDNQGSHELGTDAVHRAADQTADDKPTPNAPADPKAAKADLKERAEASSEAGDDSDTPTDDEADDTDADESDESADDDADESNDDEADTDDSDDAEKPVKAKAKKAAKTATAKKTKKK